MARYELDMQRLATMVRSRRAGRPVQDIAGEMEQMRASTLLRLERGGEPDMASFLRICEWLEMPPGEFFEKPAAPTTAEAIARMIRADASLDPATSNALGSIVLATYESLGRKR